MCDALYCSKKKNRFRLLEGTLQNQNVKNIFDIKKSNEYNFQCRFNCMTVLEITGTVPSIFNSVLCPTLANFKATDIVVV